MKAFRSWLLWIFKGREVLEAMRLELQKQVRLESLARFNEMGQRIAALEVAQAGEGTRLADLEAKRAEPVRQSPQVVQTKTWREFATLAEQGDNDHADG